MIVVADATPLLYLSRISRLDVLRVHFGQVVVPLTVWTELVDARPDAPGVDGIRVASWIVVSDRAERDGVDQELARRLDPGEAAAIQLASILAADLILLDERKGRAAARARGLRVRGLIRVLVDARRAGTIPSLRSVLDELAREGFRASSHLVKEALAAVGEDSPD